jgi:hypothetical protein
MFILTFCPICRMPPPKKYKRCCSKCLNDA